ncbi:hypothetical protein V5N11_011515 [Cardamine amara subsp. amara]|uniref:J domain-containing protein n=1 Tax=Cardamine amara subsp. amara TaxID=228776 RepID=A0ABD1AEK4_CARAN
MKQYKNLALLLHPDKNRFNGAEGAFKLVSQAWDLLSNKARRIAYDQKRMRNQPKPHESKPKPKPEPEPDSSWKYEKIVTFFTMCKRCKAYCEYVKKFSLDKTLPCPNCGQDLFCE